MAHGRHIRRAWNLPALAASAILAIGERSKDNTDEANTANAEYGMGYRHALSGGDDNFSTTFVCTAAPRYRLRGSAVVVSHETFRSLQIPARMADRSYVAVGRWFPLLDKPDTARNIKPDGPYFIVLDSYICNAPAQAAILCYFGNLLCADYLYWSFVYISTTLPPPLCRHLRWVGCVYPAVLFGGGFLPVAGAGVRRAAGATADARGTPAAPHVSGAAQRLNTTAERRISKNTS